jgi:hypothetical protein
MAMNENTPVSADLRSISNRRGSENYHSRLSGVSRHRPRDASPRLQELLSTQKGYEKVYDGNAYFPFSLREFEDLSVTVEPMAKAIQSPDSLSFEFSGFSGGTF